MAYYPYDVHPNGGRDNCHFACGTDRAAILSVRVLLADFHATQCIHVCFHAFVSVFMSRWARSETPGGILLLTDRSTKK